LAQIKCVVGKHNALINDENKMAGPQICSHAIDATYFQQRSQQWYLQIG